MFNSAISHIISGLMSDKANGFVNKGLEDLFAKLGVVSKELFTKDGKLQAFFAVDAKFIELEDLMQLQKQLGSEHIRVYTQAYSKFESVKHTGVIFAENSTTDIS
jgi:hypothetical protein